MGAAVIGFSLSTIPGLSLNLTGGSQIILEGNKILRKRPAVEFAIDGSIATNDKTAARAIVGR